MLDILKTFTGAHPGKLTAPSSEVYIFDEGHEAGQWIHDHYHPEIPVVVLPFYTVTFLPILDRNRYDDPGFYVNIRCFILSSSL